MRLLIAIFFATALNAQVFEGAEGYGSDWSFPAYEVRVVSNLNTTGAGSLKDACEAATSASGLIVVFNGISGTITLDGGINLQSGIATYIAGQTSENGIVLRMASNVEAGLLGGSPNGAIIRGLTFALGATQATAETTPATGLPSPVQGSGDGSGNVDGDNATFTSGSNIIFDHCTFLWATDESINFYGASNITMQNCLIGETLMYATHAYTTDSGSTGYFGPHSMGVLIGSGSENISIYKNIFASNNQRNPMIQPSTGSTYEVVNNVLYNIGNFGMVVSTDGTANVNFINNYAIAGGDTSTGRYPIAINTNTTAYARGNINWFRTDSGQNEWDAIGCESCANYMTDPAPTSQQTTTAHDTPLKDVATVDATTMLNDLTASVGTFNRNSAETRVINTVINDTGALIDDPSDVGGYPSIVAGTIIADADADGIPDGEEATWGDDTFGYVNSLAGGAATPVVATCTDGLQNGDETGVDCGGSCTACPEPPAATDAKKKKKAIVNF